MVAKGGAIFRSTNGGESWVSASAGLPAFLINNLEIDPENPEIAYAALARTSGAGLYRTTNGGVSWSPRGSGLPRFAVQVVRVDPTDSNAVFCGTDVGVFRSTDQGESWTRFGTGLPASSVHDIRILEDGSIVRAATHGRGIWELEVPPPSNKPPVAAILIPGGAVPITSAALTVTKGQTLDLTGLISDPDPGDQVTAAWTFPDTWRTVEVSSSSSIVSHTFERAGVFPVALLARDSRKAVSSAVVTVSVLEVADDCATPIVVPGNGPFPVTVNLNNETGTSQSGDPQPLCLRSPLGRSASLWLEFTPAVTDNYEFSTCRSAIDTVLSLWTGPACGPYTAVAGGCNDDALQPTTCTGLTSSLVNSRVEAGATIRILVTGFSTSSIGELRLTVHRALRIESASVTGKRLLVTGRGFAPGAVVLLNGEQQKTRNDALSPTTLLIAKRAGKQITENQPVTLQVRNPDGSFSDPFTFVRLGTVTQLSPPDGSIFSHFPRTTTLTWEPLPNAVSYVVEIDCFHCCASGQWCTDVGATFRIVRDITDTSYTFNFVGAQPGRWRVWAVDATGQQGPKSGWWEFRYTT